MVKPRDLTFFLKYRRIEELILSRDDPVIDYCAILELNIT